MKELCRSLGIQTEYENDQQQVVQVSDKTLKAMIELVSTGEDRLSEPGCSPVVVAWNGLLKSIELRLPLAHSLSSVRLLDEGGQVLKVWSHNGLTPKPPTFTPADEKIQAYTLSADVKLGFGYHHLRLETEGYQFTLFVIASPMRPKPSSDHKKHWGVFSPLYALRSNDDCGIGSLAELEKVQLFVKKQKGHFVGTLPFLSTVDQEKFDPSPYSPSSRLFWNEIYLDVNPVSQGHAAQDFKTLDRVDYIGVYDTKKAELQTAATDFFKNGGDQQTEYLEWLKQKPEAMSYARFRSHDEQGQAFHLYVQYQMHQRLTENRARAARNEIAALYLDFPVGVNANGFDVHHYGDAFLKGASVGAPPDSFFKGGQNWGIPPLSPQGMIDSNFEYFIKCVRNHVQYASLLRIDHVMALHRLYIIPSGVDATEGAYLHYPMEELYAIVCLEAYQHDAEIIGEDLGTVPPVVRAEMNEHDFKTMWIFELEYEKPPETALKQVSKNALISFNTHDMAPFTLFWEEKCQQKNPAVQRWLQYLGLADHTPAEKVFEKLSEKMAHTQAEMFLTNLEDLWQEREPQNIPGVQNDQIWRKKNRLSIEEWTTSPTILQHFKILRELRP